MKRPVVVAAIGTAQTLAWGSSYYLPAILADPIAQGLALSRTAVFGLFSGALLLSAVLGSSVGRAIDNRGGRGVLTLSNLVLAAGLLLLGTAQGFVTLAIAWAMLGVGMAMGLYDPAFATLTGLYGRAARGPITGITLIAGFVEHGRMAAIGLSRCTIWLARGMRHLGGAAHCDGAAVEPVVDPTRTAADPGLGNTGGEFAGAARGDGYPLFRVCGNLVCHRRHGGASAPPPRNRRRQHHGGDRGRRLGRTGAGRGTPRGIRGATYGASSCFGAFGGSTPPGRCDNAWIAWAGRDHRLRGLAWCRQWPIDDR